MANVIYRGPINREPNTVTAQVATGLKPGTVVKLTGNKLTVAGDAAGRLLILSNRRFMGQTIDDAYDADESGIAYRAEGDMEFYARLDAAAYTRGDALTVVAGGIFKKAASKNQVVAVYDGKDKTTTAADPFGDIVILSTPYAMA